MCDTGRKGGIFGQVEDIESKYDLTRGDEVHTKIFSVEAPSNDGSFRIYEDLEPSRYIFMEFKGIHHGHYIGINSITFYDMDGKEVSYKNTAVDGQDVDHETVNPAMPPKGWWAVAGEEHSLLFDFGGVQKIKEVKPFFANPSATPREIRITDAEGPIYYSGDDEIRTKKFYDDCYIQLAGTTITDPKKLKFLPTPSSHAADKVSLNEVIASLNKIPPQNGFDSFLSDDGKHCFVFYRRGLRSRAYDYYLGNNFSYHATFANSLVFDAMTEIEEVAERAMTLEELRIVRAVIVSSCVKQKWKSSRDDKPIRPDDVNLFDLNKILIKPLTEQQQCSFKELFGSGKSVPTYYCSHWWGERVLDFIRCCEYHAMSLDLKPSEARYWVCAYANRQHNLEFELGSNPNESSFCEAMELAKGILLILDPQVKVYSRIWVDFELFKTIRHNGKIDFVTHHEGQVHLLANEHISGETPYQKNRRSMPFPFENVCREGLTTKLSMGEATEEIDKVRILNVMIENMDNLDDESALERLKVNDTNNEKYKEDLSFYTPGDNALRCDLALKAISVALSLECQSPDNFFGHNLFEIIANDESRKSIVIDDMISLDQMNDEIFRQIVGLIRPDMTEVVLDVGGCNNLTDAGLDKIPILPDSLETLSLGFDQCRQLTSKALVNLSKKLPPNLTSLNLNFLPQKTWDGSWDPPRMDDILFTIANKLAKSLVEVQISTTLNSDSGDGVVALATNLPSGTKKFKLDLRAWPHFKGQYFVDMAKCLPLSLEELDVNTWANDHFEEEELRLFADEILKLHHLTSCKVNTTCTDKSGLLKTRRLNLDQLRAYATSTSQSTY